MPGSTTSEGVRRPTLFAIAALLFLFGLAGGTLRDRMPAREITFRAGYRLLEADLHSHTRFSDGFLSPFDLVIHARRRGLDALAITDHNMVFPAKLGAWFTRKTGGPTILVGEEITTRRYHVHGVGLTAKVDASRPLPEVIDEIHRQGGIVIAAHPVHQFWDALVPLRDRLDATEVMHPIAFGTTRARAGWRWEEMRDFYLDGQKQGQHLTAVASSDYHFFSPLGVCRTLVFAKGDSADAIMEALKAGRTVVYDLDGNAYGDPAMIEVLRREPHLQKPQDNDYKGNGAQDRIARICGFLGLLGILLFRPARRAADTLPIEA
jgi:predicted metal-dependent phosphoesterase TrpH